MNTFFEPWQVAPQTDDLLLGISTSSGDLVCDFDDSGLDIDRELEFARRIVACVNALAGLTTEQIEAIRPFDPSRAGVAARQVARPEQVIVYEAVEEQAGGFVGGLDEPATRPVVTMTHDEAAWRRFCAEGSGHE